MNKSHTALVFISSLLITPTTYATLLTQELELKGKITTPTCGIVIDNEGVFQMNDIAYDVIQKSTRTTLSAISNNFVVTCDAKTSLAFSTVDHQAGTGIYTSSQYYGLGLINTTGKIGYYIADLSEGKVDDTEVNVYYTTGSDIGSGNSKTPIYTNSKHGWRGKGASTQSVGEKFEGKITITPTLGSLNDMKGAPGGEIDISAGMTMNFQFGI